MLQIDQDILLWINGHYATWLDTLMLVATEKRTWITLYLTLIAAFIYLFRNRTISGWRRWMPCVIAILAVASSAGLADWVTSGLIKPLVLRVRPCNEPALVGLLRSVRGYTAGGYSFPSSHAADTMAVAISAWMLLRRSRLSRGGKAAWGIVLTMYVLLNIYSRMYLGAHYPTDIAVGLVCGGVIGACVAGISRWVEGKIPSALEGEECVPCRREKRIAVITMARNDAFFLEHWVRYYGRELGHENLYIYLDGKDQEIPECCQSTHTQLVDKLPGKIREMEKRRLAFLSDKAAELMRNGYDLVIGCDADEYIVVDPQCGQSLKEYLSAQDIRTSLSPLGIDMGQNTRCEGPFRGDKGLIDERRYGYLCPRYTKTAILAQPLQWGAGFHRVQHHRYHIAPQLYLFHFGYFDLKRIEARFADKDRAAQGVKKHLLRRSKTIRICSSQPVRDWDKTTTWARRFQQCCNQPYCWNKPSMWWLKWVVEVPERFVGTV